MKLLCGTLLVLLASITIHAQVLSTGGMGAPSGTCTTGIITYTNQNTGQFYSCVAGAWNLTAASGTAQAALPISTATQTALDLKANLNGAPFTGAVSSTVSLGYATGAGGTVTQLTSKSTGVTLNKPSGTITMINSALAAATIVTFTITNSSVAATDVIVAQHDSGGTTGAYTISPNTSAAGSFKISVRNNTAGSLSEALVIRFVVIKAVIN